LCRQVPRQQFLDAIHWMVCVRESSSRKYASGSTSLGLAVPIKAVDRGGTFAAGV
jgi:hypothetical protein